MTGRLDEIDAALESFGVSEEAVARRRRAARQADVDLASVDAALSAAEDGVVFEFSGEATGEHALGDLFEDVDATGDSSDAVTITVVDE